MKTFAIRRWLWITTYLSLFAAALVTLLVADSWTGYMILIFSTFLFSWSTRPAPHKPVSQTLADARADIARPGDDAKI